ncbi:Protein ArsC [Nocardia sp. RB56]|uniref:Protein ArsC n=1 Tax=Nocardia aurantia TaxID=2585199 RepID=A0A7K0E325_9NOCA|nr:arsenate reductase ArsC [Nocardia aurantia]MQY31554.1 Protein ArsC [Nocardia aurantia]
MSQPGDRKRVGYALLTPTYRLLELDHPTALSRAEIRLRAEFATVFDRDSVRRILHDSYDCFVAQASVTLYLPVLAERFARQRLLAQAKAEGRVASSKPVVLFLCTHNAGRSQMALGYFLKLARGRAIGWSGGTEPSRWLNPAVVGAMAEVGIDITDEYPKPWTDEIVRAADIIITLGCGDICPQLPDTYYEDWIVDDPAGLSLAQVRPIRDDLRRRVVRMLSDLHIPVAS